MGTYPWKTLPTQVSSQNRVALPSLIKKVPLVKTSSLIFISPLQKWESYSLALTYVKDLNRKYLFFSNSCHIPSVLSKFTIHFARRHLFCIWRSKMPKPPWSLGPQRMSHLASRYLCFSEDPCQKNLDLKLSRFFKTPFRISKKDIMNMGRLLSTEFSRTNHAP